LQVVIDKSEYELYVYEEGEWLATYPVVFGSSRQDDKRMEGDRLTPEGHFRIVHRKHHDEWGRFLLLDYPNPESRLKFEQLRRSGKIPSTAKIGGGIGIHGTRPSEEYAVDRYINWTLGCISLKHSEMLELYDLLPVGTPVEIRR
jgi:murein L,D-transpeptidase YafK